MPLRFGYDNPIRVCPNLMKGCAMKKAFWLLPCLALALSGADLSGKWAGTIDIEDSGSTIPIQVELVQKSDAVSGKVGRAGSGDEGTIRNGKVVYDLNGITRPEWTTLPKGYTNTGDPRWDAVTPGRRAAPTTSAPRPGRKQ